MSWKSLARTAPVLIVMVFVALLAINQAKAQSAVQPVRSVDDDRCQQLASTSETAGIVINDLASCLNSGSSDAFNVGAEA